MNAITHPQRYNRRAVSLVSVYIIVSMAILQGPTTFSWADNGVSTPPDQPPIPDKQPQPISVFVPLPPNELKKLNDAALSAVKKSPIRIKVVTDIHHATVDAKLFALLAARSITSGVPVSFQVSQGPPVTVVTDRLEQGLSGTLKWYGHVPGDPNSSVHLIVNEKERNLFGHIRIRGKVYEIRPTSSGAHTIYTLDPTRLPPDHSPDKQGQPSGQIKNSPDLTPPQIDVMVLYTQEAANQAGMGAIGPEVCLAVDQMTTSLAKSGVQATVRLVHHGITILPENTVLDLFLSDLTDPMINATGHALRNQYGADVVSVWVSDGMAGPGEGECGRAQTLFPPVKDNHTAAYSVVVRSCAANPETLSFVHELGHLLGANHDRFRDQAGTFTENNWGYVRPDKGWRTIMAYNRADCPIVNSKNYCSRQGLWSNPLIDHPLGSGDWVGRPANTTRVDCTDRTGDPSTSGCDGPADNKHTLDRAAPIVAGFRQRANALGNVSCGSGGGKGDTTPPAPPSNLPVN